MAFHVVAQNSNWHRQDVLYLKIRALLGVLCRIHTYIHNPHIQRIRSCFIEGLVLLQRDGRQSVRDLPLRTRRCWSGHVQNNSNFMSTIFR